VRLVLVPPVIEYEREFAFAVTPSALWAAIEDVDSFERWWPWLREFSLDGGALEAGSVLRGVVVPPLPYRMHVEVELVRCRRPTEIDAVVHGDLEGPARLRLSPSDAGTVARVAWSVEMMQRPMRIASQVAHPLLKWGHDRVVEVTVASFRRHLRAAGAARS
jgi:carbon monoxide dehydrogenase subunit G